MGRARPGGPSSFHPRRELVPRAGAAPGAADSLDRRSPGFLEATIHLPRPLRRAFVAFAATALAIVAFPANADTSSQLDTAKQEAAAAQAELDRVAALLAGSRGAARGRPGRRRGRSRPHRRARGPPGERPGPAERACRRALHVGRRPDRHGADHLGLGRRRRGPSAVRRRGRRSATRISRQQVSVQAQELAWERERLAAAVSDGQAAVAAAPDTVGRDQGEGDGPAVARQRPA